MALTIAPSFNPTQRKLWLAAIKPPMYTVAVIPIVVGTAVAYAQSRQFDGGIFALFLTSAIAIIAWLNLSNDVFDADTGIDVNKAHSVVNLTGKKSFIFWLSNAFLVFGLGGILLISWLQHDLTVLGLMALACCLGYSYQGPPFRLGYQGLGEVICFVTFGPLAITAVDYSQTQTYSLESIGVPAALIGVSTAIILFCSHFHQVEDDLAAGKRSPVVRLGTRTGATVLAIAVGSFYLLPLGLVSLGLMPLGTLLIVLSIPFAWQLVRHVNAYHDQPEQVSTSKFIAVNLHFFSGLLLALGYILSAQNL